MKDIATRARHSILAIENSSGSLAGSRCRFGEQADSAQSAGPNGNTVDADYEVVDEDK